MLHNFFQYLLLPKIGPQNGIEQVFLALNYWLVTFGFYAKLISSELPFSRCKDFFTECIAYLLPSKFYSAVFALRDHLPILNDPLCFVKNSNCHVSRRFVMLIDRLICRFHGWYSASIPLIFHPRLLPLWGQLSTLSHLTRPPTIFRFFFLLFYYIAASRA